MKKVRVYTGMLVFMLLAGGCGTGNSKVETQDTENGALKVLEEQRTAAIEPTEDLMEFTESTEHTGEKDLVVEELENSLKNAEMKEENVENNIETTENSDTTDASDATEWEELPAIEPSLSPEEVTDLSIEIVKSKHTLTLYNEGEEIAVYSVGVAKNPLESKEQEGDNKTPEGEYYVCNKNGKSQYHLAFGLSYPNIQDANRGFESGLITEAERDDIIAAIESGGKPNWYTALGGEIMIHGQKGDLGGQSDWTRGCCAVDNDVMDILWKYVQVGTKVTIKR